MPAQGQDPGPPKPNWFQRSLGPIFVSGQLILIYAGGWLAPLQDTGLGHIKWEAGTRQAGMVVGGILSVAIFLIFRDSKKDTKKKLIRILILIFVILIVLNFGFMLGNPYIESKDAVLIVRDILWRIAYFSLCVSLLTLAGGLSIFLHNKNEP